MYLRERVYLASVQPSLLFHLLRCIFWSSVSHVTLHPIPMVTSSLWHEHPNCVHSHCHFRDQSQLVLLKCHCQLYLYNKYNYCFWFDHTGQIPTRPGQKIISLHHGSQALVIWFTVSGTAGLLYRTIAFKYHMKTRSIFFWNLYHLAKSVLLCWSHQLQYFFWVLLPNIFWNLNHRAWYLTTGVAQDQSTACLTAVT